MDLARKLAPVALVLASAAIALFSYLQTLRYSFIMDDIGYITWNTKLSELHLTELWRLFTESYNGYTEFLPLRDLSYWLDIKLFGMNQAAFRLHNMLLYSLCLPLVYGCTLRLWRYFRPSDIANSTWAAAVVTALFALHPSHAETVVWISGCKDVLAAMFSLLALWFSIGAKRENWLSVPYAAATMLAFAAAMLSKVLIITVAPVIAMIWIIFYFDIPASHRSRYLLLWPLAMLILAGLMAWIFIYNSAQDTFFYYGVEAKMRSLAALGWLARLSISSESRHFYYPVFEDPHLLVMVALGIAVLVAALAGGAMLARKRSLEGFAIAAFFMLCMPYIHLVPYSPPSLVSDRWLMLAAWPAVLLVVALAWRLKHAPRTALLIVIALTWSWQNAERPRDWRNFETLIDADLRGYPGYYMPAVYKITSFLLPRQLYREAEIVASNITSPEFRHLMLGVIDIHHAVDADAATTGKLQNAIFTLWKLEGELKHTPDQAKWNSPVNLLWTRMPLILAIEWEYLAERFPEDVSVSYNAGLWMLDAQRYNDAISYLRSALESPLLPNNLRGKAYASLGKALLEAGQSAEAEAPLRAALEQSPPEPGAYCSLAEIHKQTGRPAEAARAESICRTNGPSQRGSSNKIPAVLTGQSA